MSGEEINWDEINLEEVKWTFNETSFMNAAKVSLAISPRAWGNYSAEKVVEHMKNVFKNACKSHGRIPPWVGTCGLYVVGTLSESTLHATAFLEPNMIQKYLEIVQKKSAVAVASDNKPRDKNWKVREIARFKTGYYKPVPWYAHEKWQEMLMKNEDLLLHFVHISKEDHECLSYTKNEENGEKDIQTKISADSWLEKYTKEEYTDYIDEWYDMLFEY